MKTDPLTPAVRALLDAGEQASPLEFPEPGTRQLLTALGLLVWAAGRPAFPGATEGEARERAEKAKGKGAVVPF